MNSRTTRLAFLTALVGFLLVVFLHGTQDFRSAGMMAFSAYCDAHQLDRTDYVSTRAGMEFGYSYMDYRHEPASGEAVYLYRVTVPWIGGPKVTRL